MNWAKTIHPSFLPWYLRIVDVATGSVTARRVSPTVRDLPLESTVRVSLEPERPCTRVEPLVRLRPLSDVPFTAVMMSPWVMSAPAAGPPGNT